MTVHANCLSCFCQKIGFNISRKRLWYLSYTIDYQVDIWSLGPDPQWHWYFDWSRVYKMSLKYSKSLSSVVIVVRRRSYFRTKYRQDQLACFSQILSVASLGWE